MRDSKQLRGLSLFLLAVSLLSAAWNGNALAQGDVLYTKYAIHVETQQRVNGTPVYMASYANYISPPSGLLLLPPNTRILLINKRKPYLIEVLDKNIKVSFEFNDNRMGMDFRHYIELITSPKPVPLTGLTELDRQGIEQGRALPGMTKRGVMTALGYPAVHRTPSLKSNIWTYWKNRYLSFRVEFTPDGRVGKIVD
jgi:hypothetical protein